MVSTCMGACFSWSVFTGPSFNSLNVYGFMVFLRGKFCRAFAYQPWGPFFLCFLVLLKAKISFFFGVYTLGLLNKDGKGGGAAAASDEEKG